MLVLFKEIWGQDILPLPLPLLPFPMPDNYSREWGLRERPKYAMKEDWDLKVKVVIETKSSLY